MCLAIFYIYIYIYIHNNTGRLCMKIVLDQLLCHLDQNNLWHTFLSVYCPKTQYWDSFLRSRTQVVTENEVKSSPSLLTCGVPQGSVLGLILFILYIQHLSDVVSHYSVSHHIFVDDTELYKSRFPSEVFTLAQTMESCVSDVKVWVVQNKLQLKDNKTEILLIGSAPVSYTHLTLPTMAVV